MTAPTPATCRYCQPVMPASVCTLHYDGYLHHWRPAGFSFDEYLAWVEIADATTAATYRSAALTPEQAAIWIDTGLQVHAALAWYQSGLTASEATAWLRVRTVTTVDDYLHLAARGHTPASAEAAYGPKTRFRWPMNRSTASGRTPRPV